MLPLLEWLDDLELWQTGVVLFTMFWIAALFGRMLHRDRADTDGSDPGLVVSASLGLLALLLGFTVSMAVSRYDGRRAAVLAEANAIGTFIYRLDLMPPGLRAEAHDALGRYIDARIRVGRMGEQAEQVKAARAIGNGAAQELWAEVLMATRELPEPAVKILLVESANQMFDMATARDAALGNRLPPTLVMLLILFPVASLVLIGYVSGKSLGVHLMASTELILLLTLVLLLIADLDRPRSGTIVTPQQPLLDVAAQQEQAAAAAVAAPAPSFSVYAASQAPS